MQVTGRRKVIAITQARLGSTRLPGKVLLKIGTESLLEIHLRRILQSKSIDRLILATTTQPEDNAIVEEARRLGVPVTRGSVDDVLDRFYQSIKGEKPDYVVRLTSDCPLIDSVLIDKIVRHSMARNLDYCSNTLEPTYPDGEDIEVLKYSALERAWKEATLPSDREHVTPFVWRNSNAKGGSIFLSENFQEGYAYGHLRMTVDEERDFDLIKQIIERLGSDKDWLTYAVYISQHVEIRSLNSTIGRNEGYNKSLKKENL